MMVGMPSDTRRRREQHYPVRIAVNVSADAGAALERAAEADGVALGVVARAALMRGLDAELDRRRKARKRAAGQTNGRGAS